MVNNIKRKIRKAHKYIESSYYVSYPNLRINGEEWNDVILFSLLTGLNGGRELLLGNPGLGKTTVAEVVGAIIYGYEPGVVQACEVHGHPYLTEEKIFGRPNLAALNKGKEEVIWSNFSLFKGPKIVDEINRIPEGTQNTLLNAIDRGIFQYLDEILFQPEVPFYATANYPDQGNTPLIPPLLDRFDISVEVVPPIGKTIYFDQAEENKKLLIDKEIREEMLRSLRSLNNEEMEKLREIYRKNLENEGVHVFYDDEIEKFREKIKEIKLSPETDIIKDVFYSDVNSIIKTPEESEKVPEAYRGYLVGKIRNTISNRWINSVEKFVKSLALVKGERKVSPETLKIVMPYALVHRASYYDDYVQRNPKPEHYPGSQQMHTTKQVVEDFFKDLQEKREIYLEWYRALTEKEYESMRKLNNEYSIPAIRGIYERIKK